MNPEIEQLNAIVMMALERSKLDGNRRAALGAYCNRLTAAGLPVIISFRHLRSLVGLKPDIFRSAVFCTEKFYRTFEIPKRRGGYRQIDPPTPVLLHCQRWIADNILKSIPVHSCVHGFREGRSIKSNVLPHVGYQRMLHIDIQDFFPSIAVQRVVIFFKELGYSPAVSSYLARLCCKDERLVQGSAASPALSNLIFKWADIRLARLAEVSGLQYTRYADDITFSGNHISHRLIDLVSEILEENGFSIHRQKTRLVGLNGRKIVTGLSITSGKITLPRETRRQLRLEVHLVRKIGIWNYIEKSGDGDPLQIERLSGRLSFWRHIEPDNRFPFEALEMLKAAMATPI